MTERERQSSFFTDPDSLELIIPPSSNDHEQDQPMAEGISVNMVDRWESMLRLMDKMGQRGTLHGLKLKTRTIDGRKKDWEEWHARKEKNDELERTPEDYRRYLKNSEAKYDRLRTEMLGDVAILLASDDMIDSGFADAEEMKRNADMALYDLRKDVYLDPKKKKAMVTNAKRGLARYSDKGE